MVKMVLYNNILETIGKTPLVKINKINVEEGIPANIFVKIEARNPGASVKDRIALNMIETAEREGLITPGESTIVEPTSGNTGIGLALVAAVKGYHLILTMPETFSVERRKVLKALGAELVLTPGPEGMNGAVNRAVEIAAEGGEKVFIPQQFKNAANPEIHRKTTALEIWDDLDGNIDVFVAGTGTGGTITGVGEVLKERKPDVHVVVVEPAASPLLSGGQAGPHPIQGIGPNFIPDILNQSIYDEIITIEKDEAFEYARRLAKTEGIFVGISSGAAFAASIKYAKNAQKEENIVVILPDTGERYISTPLWDLDETPTN
jgi:cysteine synthase A